MGLSLSHTFSQMVFNPLNPIVHYWLHHTAHCAEKIVSARLCAGSASAERVGGVIRRVLCTWWLLGSRGPPRRVSAYEISKSTGFQVDFGFQNGFLDFWISKWISGFQSGFLDFRMDFWISDWISGFHSGFLDFTVDFWISAWISGFLDFSLDFCRRCTRFLS